MEDRKQEDHQKDGESAGHDNRRTEKWNCRKQAIGLIRKEEKEEEDSVFDLDNLVSSK